MEIKFVDAENADLLMLAAKLDEYYFAIVGEVHKRYAKYNDPYLFGCRAVVYIDGKPAGCGCWKRVDGRSVEVKRIYVLPEYRRQGVASAVTGAVERDAVQHGYTHAILETARTTGDSAALYLKLGYREMPYYGSPAGADNCRCFEKELGRAPEAELRFVDVPHPDLLALVAELDAYFHAGWGEVAENYKQYHALDGMACAVVAYIEGKPVGCGCWRAYDPITAEVKRMYVRPAYRRLGVAGKIVAALEQHAAAGGCRRAVLETGADMPDAIAFYEKHGYRLTPNFGDFAGDEICVCMEKELQTGDEVTAMILFWKRRILLVTYSLNERVRVCSVLSANGIEYEVDVRNMAARQQGWAGTLGINLSAATEYRISVDKDDYDQACYVVNQRR